jgi:hypothetical protein
MTLKKHMYRFALVTAIVASGACSEDKSENPLGPDVAGPIPGVVISAPAPIDPPAGAQFTASGAQQTLVIQNATTNGQRALWMELDVASDAAFQAMVHREARINPDPSGRTSYRLPNPLSAGRTYYWRMRALDGANTGPYSAAAHFSIVDPVVLGAPTPLEPTGSIATNRPEFRATNGAVSGPAGGLIIRFEVATAPDPAAIVAVVSTTPGGSGTTTMSLGELPWNKTFYWRTYATDGTSNSPFSGVLSFKTPAAPSGGGGPPLPPGPPPPPGGGTLPFPVPAECGPFGPDGRRDCVLAVAAQSAEWAACARGNGVACHRFSRQVVYSLSRSDPNFQMILVGGGHGCDCNRCGDGGERYREDTTVYGGSRVYDMIGGAGGPSPTLGWSFIGANGPRPGDLPRNAPVCP